jgi:hypothetical protein
MTEPSVYMGPDCLLCKSADVDIAVACMEKHGRRFNYLRSPVSTLLVTAHFFYVLLSLYIFIEWHVPPPSPPLPPSTTPMATFVPRRTSDLARVICEYEAGGLHDVAAVSDPAVPPVLNWSSPISSRPLWSTRVAAAALAA